MSAHTPSGKKVSVIMGAYNCAPTIMRAIASIRSQTYTNWELIICDDGSKDGTLDIVRQAAEADGRIRVLTNEVNMQLAATLNKCLAAASGDYIARMDGDDESAPTRFEKQVQLLDELDHIACVGCNILIMGDDGAGKVRAYPEHPEASSLIHGAPFAHPTIMMRREAYELLGGYVDSPHTLRCEDLEMWFRFFAHGLRGCNIQQPLYHYKETLSDYKRRSVRSSLNAVRVSWAGFKLNALPRRKYIYCLKPLISALLPASVMRLYHRCKDSAQ